jgi:hypothetical protein
MYYIYVINKEQDSIILYKIRVLYNFFSILSGKQRKRFPPAVTDGAGSKVQAHKAGQTKGSAYPAKKEKGKVKRQDYHIISGQGTVANKYSMMSKSTDNSQQTCYQRRLRSSAATCHSFAQQQGPAAYTSGVFGWVHEPQPGPLDVGYSCSVVCTRSSAKLSACNDSLAALLIGYKKKVFVSSEPCPRHATLVREGAPYRQKY